MAQVIGKNLLKFVVLMFAVSVVTFLLVGISPIDPVQANVGQAAYAGLSPEKKADLAAYWGSNLPVWQRYLNWLAAAAHGDFGVSLRFNAPVTELLATRSLNTLVLMLVAWVLSGVIGFAMGATSNAMANMQVVTKKNGPSPVAYFAIPMVGGMFIDFFNAVLISANISWWA